MLNRNKLATATVSESEDNTEVLAKQECLRLTKQLRLMENDKKAYTEESRASIELQKKVLNSLETGNSEIEEELKIKEQEQILGDDEQQQILQTLDKLGQLNQENTTENRGVAEDRQRFELIQQRVNKLEAQQQQQQNGDPQEVFHIGKIQSKLFQMKKKLETVTAQFDSLVASNGDARAKIDELLEENVSIAGKLSHLEAQLGRKKATAQKLVQEATIAYDQREESSSKMSALSERSLKEKRQFTLEIGELTRVIRNEEKLLHFLSSKNKDRTFLETDEERISRVELAKEQVLDLTLESYRQNFETLLTNASPSYTSLVEKYSDLHKSNIRHFAEINELTIEIENLQASTSHLRQEVRKYSAETVQINQKRQQEIETKQEKFEELKSDFSEIESRHEELQIWLKEAVRLIQHIFNLTDQAESVSMLELVGPQREISSENMVLYISILEQRIKEILKQQQQTPPEQFINGMSSPSSFTLLPGTGVTRALSDIVTANASRPRITVSPKAGSEHAFNPDEEIQYDLIASEVNPLTYANMRFKLLESASRAGSTAGSRRSSISGRSMMDAD